MAENNIDFKYPSYVQDIMGPMCFDYGFGPFRWVCTSGKPEDLKKETEFPIVIPSFINNQFNQRPSLDSIDSNEDHITTFTYPKTPEETKNISDYFLSLFKQKKNNYNKMKIELETRHNDYINEALKHDYYKNYLMKVQDKVNHMIKEKQNQKPQINLLSKNLSKSLFYNDDKQNFDNLNKSISLNKTATNNVINHIKIINYPKNSCDILSKKRLLSNTDNTSKKCLCCLSIPKRIDDDCFNEFEIFHIL